MGICESSDADGPSGVSSSLFGNPSRPRSFSVLRVKLKHAKIDSTKPYKFWVRIYDKTHNCLNPGETKKVQIRCGAEDVIVLQDLPKSGGYFVQLMTGDRKEYKVRGLVDADVAATRSEKGDVAELEYAPIIPNEWMKPSGQTLLSIWVSLHPDQRKSKSLWFRACGENGRKIVDSGTVKVPRNDGSYDKAELRSWVPMNAVKEIQLYVRSFSLVSSPKPFAQFEMPGSQTTTHLDGFDNDGKLENLTQRKVPDNGLQAPMTKITIENLNLN